MRKIVYSPKGEADFVSEKWCYQPPCQASNGVKAFTLIEILVVLAVFLVVVGAIYSSYLLSQRAFIEGEGAVEITQNGRVVLERMAREIRQARDIVTELPATKETATSTLEFEDGNRTESYHYIHYFKDGSEIKREVKRYYFSGDPNTFVAWNSTPPPGEELLWVITEQSQIIGELAQDLKFWSSAINIVDIFLTLKKDQKQADFSTRIFGRNL